MRRDIKAWRLQGGWVVPDVDADGLADDTFDVMQRVLLVLLTETDSARYTFGKEAQHACSFMSAWRRGEIRHEGDLRRIFTLCLAQIRTAMEDQQTRDDPPSCRYRDLQLLSVHVMPGYVQLEMWLQTHTDDLKFKLALPKE